MAKRKTAKRPSKAAVARELKLVEQKNNTAQELPAHIAALIAHYEPRDPTGKPMDLIRPFLVAVIGASNIRGDKSVLGHRSHLTDLATYALGRGVPLTVEQVLKTHLIDEHVRLGMTKHSTRNKQLRRTLLMNVAKTANPGPDVPAKLTPMTRTAIKPCYTPAEMATIMRVCRTQMTDARSRDLLTMVCLGAGAGLDSMDLRHLRICHICYSQADGGYLIHVPGSRARQVPLRASFDTLIANVIARRGKDELVLGKIADRHNITGHVLERATLHNVPRLEQSRLRATWLADLMTDPIPLAVILRAAGLKSARSMVDLLPHLDPWYAHKGLASIDARDGVGGAR